MNAEYVVVYPNDPRFKGLDEYVVDLMHTSADIEAAFLFQEKTAHKFIKRFGRTLDGHLPPVVKKIKLVTKRILV